jgi:carbon-monoxide dehydrogenase medium subunit
MIPQDFEYASPATLAEALSMLAGGDAKPLAGGMSLIPMMKLRLAAPEKLVDLGRLSALSYIRDEDGAIHIGATTTHYQIESSELLRKRCPLLPQTASEIGDLQVRNMGTIGGSVAHADPAADYPGALQALEAKVKLVSSSGERVLSIDDFLVDTFTTALEPGEIVTEIVVSAEQPGTGVSYRKCAQPASGFALVGVGARVRMAAGKVALARIGVTGLAPRAYRALQAEAALEGTAGSAADLQKASALVAEGVEPLSDLHASAEYRAHLARVYAMRALAAAVSRIA